MPVPPFHFGTVVGAQQAMGFAADAQATPPPRADRPHKPFLFGVVMPVPGDTLSHFHCAQPAAGVCSDAAPCAECAFGKSQGADVAAGVVGKVVAGFALGERGPHAGCGDAWRVCGCVFGYWWGQRQNERRHQRTYLSPLAA